MRNLHGTLRWNKTGRHSTPGVSCDRCGLPFAPEKLLEQDGLFVCKDHYFKHGEFELDAIDKADPDLEPLTAQFGGPGRTTGV